MELRKCCNHPYLLKGVEDSLPPSATADLHTALETMVAASGKLDLVDKMLVKLIPGGHRMLIYSQFTTVLNILEDWLTGRGWGYQRIDGGISKLLFCSCTTLMVIGLDKQDCSGACDSADQIHLFAEQTPLLHTKPVHCQVARAQWHVLIFENSRACLTSKFTIPARLA